MTIWLSILSTVVMYRVSMCKASQPCSLIDMCNCTMRMRVRSRGANVTEYLPIVNLDCHMKSLTGIPTFEMLKNGAHIKELILSNNSFPVENLSNRFFKGLEIEKLDLSNNQFAKIPYDAFSPLKTNLKTLVLENVGLTLRNLNFLKQLTNLKSLSLKGNILKGSRRLLSGSFPPIGLEELNLSDNHISRIPANIFENLRSTLRVLYLENIDLNFTNLNLDFLFNLTHLERLYLGRNGKVRVHFLGNHFQHLRLTSLRFLSLTDCEIELIKGVFFAGIESLTELDLSLNKLYVVRDALSRLTRLVSLNLSHNINLVRIEENVLAQMENLRFLNMDFTNLRTIAEHAFSGLENSLQVLSLANTKLPGGHFWISAMRPLISLKKLNISNNKMRQIHNETFEFLLSLEELDISGNIISVYELMDIFKPVEGTLEKLYMRNMKLHRLPNQALSTMDALKVLDVSQNVFPTLTDKFFYGVKAKTIIISNCLVSNINVGAFKGLLGPLDIILDGNNISDLSFVHHQKHRFFGRLSLINNPLRCDCLTASLVYQSRVTTIVGQCQDQYGNATKLNRLAQNQTLLQHCRIVAEKLTDSSDKHTLSLIMAIFAQLFLLSIHSRR